MASRTDVIMAGFDRDVAGEELKEEQKIRKSKGIRALDTVTAMSEGAQMGMALHGSISELGTSVKDMGAKFKTRRQLKDKWVSKQMATPGVGQKEARKSWRKEGRGNRKEYLKNWDEDAMTSDELVSMYLQGTNVTHTNVDPEGNVEVETDSETGNNGNIMEYPNVEDAVSNINKVPGAGISGVLGITSNPMSAYGHAEGFVADTIIAGAVNTYGKAKDAWQDDPNDPNDWYAGKYWKKAKAKDAEIEKAGGLLKYMRNK